MKSEWCIWDIKSPWLRIPAAWLFAVLWFALAVPILITLGAIIGAFQVVRDAMDWSALKQAMTDRRRG